MGLIEQHYRKVGQGTQPMPPEQMQRTNFMHHWFNQSDSAMEDALYDSESMRRFAGIELVEAAVPDESTIPRFPHLLERHGFSEQIFRVVRGPLEKKRRLLKSGTIVDATIIDAPPSTRNEVKAHDPEMKQGKRNAREWRFGIMPHVDTDPNGLVHTLAITHAAASEFNHLPKLLHGKKRAPYGDRPNRSELRRLIRLR